MNYKKKIYKTNNLNLKKRKKKYEIAIKNLFPNNIIN